VLAGNAFKLMDDSRPYTLPRGFWHHVAGHEFTVIQVHHAHSDRLPVKLRNHTDLAGTILRPNCILVNP
jgi:hypothetical protein